VAFWVTLGDSNPRIFAQLLQTQRYTSTLAVELQNLDGDFVANVDDFGRMLNALPSHVGDVQQAVNTTQIYECTVVGQVLDDTLDFLAFLQVSQQASRSEVFSVSITARRETTTLLRFWSSLITLNSSSLPSR
jgi:hypothetical protein